MLHDPLYGMATRRPGKNASSLACLAFVAMLAVAFWAGALWIGNTILQLFAS